MFDRFLFEICLDGALTMATCGSSESLKKSPLLWLQAATTLPTQEGMSRLFV